MRNKSFRRITALLLLALMMLTSVQVYAEETGGDSQKIELPEAVYEFTMNGVESGTGDLEGKKVIVNNVDGSQYPIYGNYRVDDYGIYDQSIEFDGSTTYVNIGKPERIKKTYTFSAWTNIDSETQSPDRLNKIFGRDRTSISDANAMYFTVRGTGNIEFTADEHLADGSVLGGWFRTEGGVYGFNDWHHVAVTSDGETVKIYYDGEEVAQQSDNGGPDLSKNELDVLIGAGYNAEGTGIFAGHAFKGRLDDVKIYDQTLTEEQIKESLKGIQIPLEIRGISPAEGELIDEAGQLKVTFNMPVAFGEERPTISMDDGTSVDVVSELLNLDGEEGTETLMITPKTKLEPGKSYIYKIPAGSVINESGASNVAKEYTYSVRQGLDGDAEQSDQDYWVTHDVAQDSQIEEKDSVVTISNGLVERSFDISENFVTKSYKNLYTGISLLNGENLQSDVILSLNDKYVDNDTSSDTVYDVGGTDETIPTFRYVDYTVEEKTEEIFHWEYDPIISPESMKDSPWPAEGKALVVNYEAPENAAEEYKDVTVQVRYEIYDGIPVICKKVSVSNTGDNDVVIHRMTVESLPVNTATKDALYLEGSMNDDGGKNHDRNNGRLAYINWSPETNTSGVLTHQYAKTDGTVRSYGPNYRIKNDETFTSYRLYELFYSSGYFEWQNMEVKKMYRTLFPQTADAPLIYHCISSDSNTIRKAIDEADNAGFNMVLLSFGSGVNTEDTSAANIAKYKELADYAHSKDIKLGAYMMQVARGDGGPDDIYSGGWGRMRCLTAGAAKRTQENVLTFIEGTGLDCLEIDGIYPGEACTISHEDKGARHEGTEDSIVKQREYGVDEFYQELRKNNVYINAPDWNFMSGANMAVMGYVEEAFNITPKAQLIYGREMAYYGTFEKIPAMGWTLVPLSPYKGGADSSFWPYNEKITEYDYMVGLNMLYGVVGSYRGANGLYQEGPAKNVMETWGEFYEKYRDILGSDIVHIAPPIAKEYEGLNPKSETTTAIDGIIHVSLDSEQKGLAAFFNQTGETVTQTVKIPLYYTGLTDLKVAPSPMKGSHYRKSGVYCDMINLPAVPEIPEVEAMPTDKKAYVCIGDMDGQEYTIDSNGNIEVELTMEPNTYTWLTVYDPADVPEALGKKSDIHAPQNIAVSEKSSSQVTLTWDAVRVSGRDVKEYHIYRNGEYIGKTFENKYTDTTLEANQQYAFDVVSVHNTVSGEKSSIEVSTTPDTTAPSVIEAKALSKNQIEVIFDESVEESSAENSLNYEISGNTVEKAELASDKRTVTLTVTNELAAFEEQEVSISGVSDLTGNVIKETAKAKFVFGYLREFKFEESDGNIAVDSVSGEDGQIIGDNPVRETGVSGNGLFLDGNVNYVNVGFVVNKLSEYSISGWFKAEDTDKNQTLIGQQRESYDGWRWNLYIENGNLKFAINNGKGSYAEVVSEDEIAVELTSNVAELKSGDWNQFAVVRDDDTFILYLNGEKVAEETKAGIDQTRSPYPSWIGGYANNAGGEPENCFKGVVDEILFYNTPITEQKVKELYGTIKDAEIPVEGVALNKNEIALKPGKEAQLEPTVQPENATNKAVSWESSDESVAVVDDGRITAKKEGEAVITVKTQDGGMTAECKVVVRADAAPVYDITVVQTKGGKITPGNITVEEGESQEFTVKADEGYVLKDVLVDEKSVGAVTKYIFENVREEHKIQAIFDEMSDGTEVGTGKDEDNKRGKEEGTSSKKNDNANVKTGDSQNIYIWILAAGISIIVMIILIMRRKKSK